MPSQHFWKSRYRDQRVEILDSLAGRPLCPGDPGFCSFAILRPERAGGSDLYGLTIEVIDPIRDETHPCEQLLEFAGLENPLDRR